MDKSIADLLKKLFSGNSLLKIVAVILAGCAAYGATGTVPKMASASGAPINDVLNTLLPALGSAATWFASTYFKIKPDLIQAALAVYANPKDPVVDLRLVSEVFLYIQEQWPEAPEAVKLIGEGVKKLTDAVASDLVKPPSV